MLALLATVIVGISLAGCGMTATTTKDGQVGFPDPAWASMKEGTFVNVDDLRKVLPGLTKNQVLALVGAPHFQEFAFTHVWNYIFDFRMQDGRVAQCQYQVQYDSHMRVKATYWRNPQCEQFVNPSSQPAPSPIPAPVMQHVRLNGDVSFDTGSAVLKPAASNELDSLIARSRGMTFDTVVVSGYTDSRGNAQRNQGLSERRAASVVNYLQAHGLRAQHYEAHGYGASNPVATNATNDGRAQNRRVEIDFRQ